MNKKPNRFWLIILLLGLSIDFLFWKKSIGINFAIFAVLCVIGGFYLLVSNALHPAKKSLWLLFPLLFFLVITFLRQEPLTSFLAFLFVLFFLGVLASTYLGGRWFQYSLLDYVKNFLNLGFGAVSRPPNFFKQLQQERAERSDEKELFNLMPILRGVLLALPIVLILAALLASADLVYQQKLTDFLDLFSFEKILEYTFRFFLVGVGAYVLTGVFLHAATKSQDEKLLEDEHPIVKPFLGFTEAAIILGSVVILFMTFVIIQFQYFFGGEVNLGIDGYTFSQYARRGFSELNIVAFFSLLLILGLSIIAHRQTHTKRRVFSALSAIIVMQVMVILVSSYQRLDLAIGWHGYSRLRLYPRIFLIWLGLLLVAVVLLEIYRLERYFTLAFLIASIGFSVSLSLTNVDASIVRYNIYRETQGKHLNYFHLASLSSDAVPALVEEFQGSNTPPSVSDNLGAVLLCYAHSEKLTKGGQDWRSYNFSRWQARKSLIAIQEPLGEYRVNDKKSPVRVHTPAGELFRCPR